MAGTFCVCLRHPVAHNPATFGAIALFRCADETITDAQPAWLRSFKECHYDLRRTRRVFRNERHLPARLPGVRAG